MLSESGLNSTVIPRGSNGHADHVGANGIDQPSNGNEDYSMSESDVPLSQTTQNKSHSSTPAPRMSKRKKPAILNSSSDEDIPLALSPGRSRTVAVPIPGAIEATTLLNGNLTPDEGESSGDEVPLHKRAVRSKPPMKGRPRKKPKVEDGDAGSEDSDVVPKQKKRGVRGKKATRALDVSKEPGKGAEQRVKEEDGPPIAKARRPKKQQSTAKTEETISQKKGKAKKEEEEEPEEVFRWWEGDATGDGSIKWQTLEHNGVIFPPPYEPLPLNVKMKYNGKTVNLSPAAEEVAGFYAAMLETDHAQDGTFNKNFFEDWKKVLKENPPLDGTNIASFELCDFRPMFEHFEAEKARKKALSTAEKKEIKKAKEEMEAKYVTCLLDSRKEKVGNFRVEPPGLFRGRGEHPKKGALKLRVRPEDITINIGEGAPVPVPNMSGNWKQVIHDQTVTWLANWTENVNGNHKYVFLAAGSSLKGQSDMTKFEKARELKNHVDRIRKDYETDLRNKTMADRQRATAMYFIDKLALRAGNEKGEDEADTVGCCSLRCEHVTLELPNFIIFDFLGKDSIRYYNRVPVDAQVFKNIRIFKENKNDDDNLFDRVNTGTLNKHLNSYMKGLTAKVFRTYNASITFQQQLDTGTPVNASIQEKLNAYNHANRMVAILCNHQRSVPKTHEQSMEKMRYKLRSFKYERMKLRHVLFGIDPKYKKKKKYSEGESDIDEEWVAEHEEQLKLKEIEKAEKKFAKENEKLAEEGKAPQKESVLKERIKDVNEEFKRLEQERGTQKATLKRDRPTEKLEESIDKLDEKIKAFKLQIEDRDAGKEVALGTSKINYLDPRITSAWCKTHDVPIEKIFSKTLLTKFPWAMQVENDWKF